MTWRCFSPLRAPLRLARPVASCPPAAAEIALALTGIALSLFVTLHTALLATALFGAAAMDRLALFLERNYLVHAGSMFLALLVAAHALAAVRKLPKSARECGVLWRSAISIRHWSTWMWLLQIVSGGALLALIAAHTAMVLTDLPIRGAASAARIGEIYGWFYLPFIVFIEIHVGAGLYRIAAKWDLRERPRFHFALGVGAMIFLSLGFVLLAAAFYRIGATA